MPWQREVALVGCEIDPDSGLPAYREVVVTVPRQSGKTTLFLAWQINRCLSPRWRHPQRSAFTAQSGKDARDKWLDELYPLIKASKLNKLQRQMTRGMGNEYVAWKTGSLIRLLSTSSSSGHSKTLHQAVLDEVWHDQDDRREQGLRPAMITVQDAQLLVCSTAGTAASVVLNRKTRLGREAVEADSGHGMAYFEYSAPDNWDPADEDLYVEFMPALCPAPPCRCGVGDGGWIHTVTVDAIRSERVSMDPPEFARAYGNIPTPAVLEQPISLSDWQRTATDRMLPPGEVPVFFLAVSPGMRAAAIGAAFDVDGVPHGELADQRPGVDWLVERAIHLKNTHSDAVFAVEAQGAVGALLPELADAGIEPERYTASDMGRGCAHMQKLVADKTMTHSDDPLFADVLAGAVKRDVGEGLWVWSHRKSSTDVVPLVAVTEALWLLRQSRYLPAIY
jgi:phage terminase large subunit-like protein